MKFEHTAVWGFEHAVRGMRNPKSSWKKSDSSWELVEDRCDKHEFLFGENDMKLAQTLIKAGSEHRKFMRQIFVSVDITAPLYWWKEFDTYKIGTVANSTSTMHRLTSSPITKNCFEMDDYNSVICDREKIVFDTDEFWNKLINILEELRQSYLKTKDKRTWKEIVRLLPESWLQTRTVTMSYENLFAICGRGQRRFHKLSEWSGIDGDYTPNFISWARSLPYAKELIFIDETQSWSTGQKTHNGYRRSSMKVVCISGKARHGKDTLAKMLEKDLKSRGNKVLITHFGDLVKYICEKFFAWDGVKDERGRTLLQHVGTDIIRAQIPNYWTEFIVGILKLFPDEWDYVLIPDCRFPNEVECFRENDIDTKLIRINRPRFVSDLTPEQSSHLSETAMDNYPYVDIFVTNDGAIDDLAKHITGIINQL